MDTHEVLSLCCQSALTSNHNHKHEIKMKKTETLYSYLYKKSNKMWAVKYKFHKKDAYKNTSLGTRNKREAEDTELILLHRAKTTVRKKIMEEDRETFEAGWKMALAS